jgi:hypothetical protein
MRKTGVFALILIVFISGMVYLFSCGGGGSRTLLGDVSFDIGDLGKDIMLTADETWSVIFTVTYDPGSVGGPFGAMGINLQENLAGLTFTPGGGVLSEGAVPLGGDTGQLWLRIDRAEAFSTVCTTGEAYGPFEITLDGLSQPSSVSPASTEASQTTMDIINLGAYSVCVQVVSPIDAEVDLNSVGFQIAECGEDPANIEGTWAGPFICENNCGGVAGTIEDYVELTITQNMSNPSLASYEDSWAYYEGHVCGYRFSFKGGSASSSESGTFVMNPNGYEATKTSTYRNYDGYCTGTCSDILTRVD